MITSRKYRIYPTKKQEEFLNKHFDAVRFVYNLALETKNMSYYDYGLNLSKNDCNVFIFLNLTHGHIH